MRNIASQLNRGHYYFGSGSVNSEQFNQFFEDFKKSFTRELKKIGATKLLFSKGHFYLSGFFTIQEQAVYFSISDVRSAFNFSRSGNPQMLVRTAKNYEDYSGGANKYVDIEPNMSKEILRVLGMDVNLFKKAEVKKVDKDAIVEKILHDVKAYGTTEVTVKSTKMANSIAWKVGGFLGVGNFGIRTWRMGRSFVRSEAMMDGFEYNYEVSNKRLNISYKMSDEQLLNSLELAEEDEYVTNPYSGQGCKLDPLGVALHDYIKGCEMLNQHTRMQQGLRIFAEKYPNEYMILLD